MIGKVEGEEWVEVRQLKGNFVGKEVSSIIFSSFHSLIGFVMGCSVYLLDYEQFRIVSRFNFRSENRPTSICFANGLELLVVGTAGGDVYVFEIRGEGEEWLKLKIGTSFKGQISHVLVDLQCRKIFKKISLDCLTLYYTTGSGKICSVDLTEELRNIPFKTKKTNHFCNPHRQVR